MPRQEDRARGAYEAIVKRLLLRELGRGEHVVEEQLAEELGISRTPLREALRMLVTQGVLEERRHRGRFVPRRSPEEVVQIGEARQAIEGMIARTWAERAEPARVAVLRELAEATHEAAICGAVEDYYKLDFDFHSQLVSQCPNPYLAQYSNAEALILNTFINMPFMEQIPLRERGKEDSLGGIVSAIERHDAVAAEAAARAHLSYLAVRTLRMQEDEEPAAPRPAATVSILRVGQGGG